MNEIYKKIVKKLKFMRGFFPKKLPVGVTEFNKFIDDILFVYDFPNYPSYRHAIATQVLHLGDMICYKSPYFFALKTKASQSKQVAYEIVSQIKEDQKREEILEKAKLEEQNNNGEDTPQPVGASRDESVPEQSV